MSYSVKMWSMADLERRIVDWVKGSSVPEGLRAFKVAKLSQTVCRVGLDIDDPADRSEVTRAFARLLSQFWVPPKSVFDIDFSTFVRGNAYEVRRRVEFFEHCKKPEVFDPNEATNATHAGEEPDSLTFVRDQAA